MVANRFDYDALMKDAAISVVKRILKQVGDSGFYKKQHLYITFDLRHPNVDVSPALKEEYEDEMTIVLQHEFWDLKVDDFGFSVSLAFEDGDETIYVPYSSLVEVSDPSENFVLEFSPDYTDIKANEAQIDASSENAEDAKIISIDFLKKR